MEEKNTETTTTISADMNKSRGRPAGSTGTCSRCKLQGHNKTTCPERPGAGALIGNVPGDGKDLLIARQGREIARLTQSGAGKDREIARLTDRLEMVQNGAEYVIYGIWCKQTSRYHYVGKSFGFQKRAYSHARDGIIADMREIGLDGQCVPLKSRWFLDKERGKAWVAKWESYYMMFYNQHKYRLEPSSYNTNSVSTMGDHMRKFHMQKEALEQLPEDHILRDDSQIEELSRVLNNYERYLIDAEEKARAVPLSSVAKDVLSSSVAKDVPLSFV